ncbi:MAG TPA: hypothetical protein VJZ04_12055 [Lachnospiraceae bacterium]|nr:hypothetical protein [Lachnospiraceae bacterium]
MLLIITSGIELEIVDNKKNIAMDKTEYTETTLADADKIKVISDFIHSRGGKVMISVNFVLPWLLNRVEPYADGLMASFDTLPEAQIDVLTGKYKPRGVLPFTLPASLDVIAVDENNKSISPNDVPGYDKDQYMPEGLSYSYVDADGNRYVLDYGLSY